MPLAATGGAPNAVGPTSGGKTYAFNNLGTSPQTVLQPNAFRTSVTFHNPGPNPVFVYTLQVQNSSNSAPTTPTDTNLVPSTSALGGCWAVLQNGGQITFTGECQKGWGAFSALGSNNPLTVSESNQP